MSEVTGAEVLADRERLIDAEQNVLLDVATAYMDVLRDRAVLKLAMNNEQRLRRQLEAARFSTASTTLSRPGVPCPSPMALRASSSSALTRPSTAWRE